MVRAAPCAPKLGPTPWRFLSKGAVRDIVASGKECCCRSITPRGKARISDRSQAAELWIADVAKDFEMTEIAAERVQAGSDDTSHEPKRLSCHGSPRNT